MKRLLTLFALALRVHAWRDSLRRSATTSRRADIRLLLAQAPAPAPAPAPAAAPTRRPPSRQGRRRRSRACDARRAPPAPTEPQLVAVDKISSGDTAWMLTSTALVLLMTIPGLALFYGGMVRKKNVLATLMQSFAITSLVIVLWVVIGYTPRVHAGRAISSAT